jgi:hypothetical protein
MKRQIGMIGTTASDRWYVLVGSALYGHIMRSCKPLWVVGLVMAIPAIFITWRWACPPQSVKAEGKWSNCFYDQHYCLFLLLALGTFIDLIHVKWW